MKHRIPFLALAMGAMALAQGSTYSYTYSFAFNSTASYTISDAYILEYRTTQDDPFYYGFRQDGVQVVAPLPGSVSDYPDTLTAPATESLIIAVTSALPGDPPGQQHVLLGMDNTAASYAAGIDWGTLFTHTNEDDIIYDLENYENADPTITQNALDGLANFADGDAMTGILDNQGQSHTAWFTPAQNSSFTLMTWSGGQVVGTGTANFQSVPEPAPMIGLGLGVVGLLIRRRRK